MTKWYLLEQSEDLTWTLTTLVSGKRTSTKRITNSTAFRFLRLSWKWQARYAPEFKSMTSTMFRMPLKRREGV